MFRHTDPDDGLKLGSIPWDPPPESCPSADVLEPGDPPPGWTEDDEPPEVPPDGLASDEPSGPGTEPDLPTRSETGGDAGR